MNSGWATQHHRSSCAVQLGACIDIEAVCRHVISGTLLLDEVDGAHLDYEIILNILAEPHGGLPQSDNEPKVAIVMCISETYVPRARRGRGIGAQLASAAFAIAAVRGWLVWPKCSYISDSFLGVDPEPTSADGKPLASLVVTPNQKGNPHLVLAAH